MADTLNKPKLQSVISVNGGSKTPTSPAAKLMLNHGKPNFTIQRSPKVQENGDNSNPLSPQLNGNNNNNYNAFRTANNNSDIVVKSTKFNGVFKPSNISLNDKQPHQQQSSENEAAKVVLRRPKVAEEPLREGEDENVPEFIRRQRRIQERLAKENVLDFENRRSGYFTHVMISPSSPNRTSFVETMSSPATIAALEIPAPAPASPSPSSSPLTPSTVVEEDERSLPAESEPAAVLTNGTTNGHAVEEEEEVAKAIEEVNKAVEGEDDNISVDVEAVVIATPAVALLEEEVKQNVDEIVAVAVATTMELIDTPQTPAAAEENTETAELPPEVALAVAAVTVLENIEEPKSAAPVENGTVEEAKQNGHATTNGNDDVTISHTNGTDGPCIPSPDPSGALGVNYEPKTVVSFSKDLGEPNKYPDTVKIVKEGGSDETVKTPVDAELQEMAKLKFDIKADEQDVQVTPVLRAE